MLIACLIAESGLNPFAEREGVWPDVSYGLGQQIVLFANGYGIGDGSDTPANRAACKAALFDRATAIAIAADHLKGNYLAAQAYDRPDDGDSLMMLALTAYNSGSPKEPGSAWYREYAANVASYQRALAQAHTRLVV